MRGNVKDNKAIKARLALKFGNDSDDDTYTDNDNNIYINTIPSVNTDTDKT